MNKLGWIKKLYDTYENCSGLVGVRGTDVSKSPLLPLSHTIINANIEIVLDDCGNLVRARTLFKDESMTVAPCTEDSASRGNGNYPHALFDKLQYVAGDYTEYFKDRRNKMYFLKYVEQLELWCKSEYKDEKVIPVLNYVKKESMISDLISLRLLVIDENKQIVNKWTGDKDNKPHKVSDIFVRFTVESSFIKSKLYEDQNVFNKYNNYYLSTKNKRELCYIQGRDMLITEKHQSKIRSNGDAAKLISANDETGFTYLGRFTNSSQVVSIGYETSQKAHNVLKWLIENQGYKHGSIKEKTGQKVVLAWGTNRQDVPKLFEDTEDSIFGYEEPTPISTEKDYAQRLSRAIAGYGYDLNINSEVVIMALDAATTGRLSMTYYREINGKDFLDRIENWHKTCFWKHSYKKLPDGTHAAFIGAPASKDIALVAFGVPRENIKGNVKELKIGENLLKATMERLLHCIVDGARLPYDIVKASENRASNPISMERLEWDKALTISCALIRKYRYDKYKEVWSMSLDESQSDRSYLFGRLLAIAQQIEEWALNDAGEKRDTNAERLMHQFKLHPYKTWGIISDKLRPYISRLGPKCTKLTDLMTNIGSTISFSDFTSLKRLEDSYLLGYYCQREVFVTEKNQRKIKNEKKKLNIKEEAK